ncbi:hypothetical protein NLG97_g10857 [Lecanicillium saksenae]|uniref:Uncharacterized protein n=1 Tax=Lecanicillium saksenae TaxID=468837 RepID=A0ACC1QEG5_9HYPO|nr:hypothetical protein NLG97_g10857 [Lecanicillium saksenae]
MAHVMAPAIAIESQLALQAVARDTRDALFELYIDIFDKPLSQCILPGSMPPRHQLGVAALSPLSKSALISTPFSTAGQWIRSCDGAAQGFGRRGSTDAIPQIFHALSLLDALFQQEPRWRVSESRNTAITEAYRWVAVACAAQFSPAAAAQVGRATRLELLLASFRRARGLIFESMSAVTSFRLAFSMLVFGCISLPGTGQETQDLRQDASYALGEGMRRLRLLCSRANEMLQGPDAGGASLHQKLTLSPCTCQLVRELVAGVEWLTDIMIATIISSSRSINLASPASCQLETTLSQYHRSIHFPDVNLTLLLLGGKNQEEAENGILARTTTQTKSAILLWEAALPINFINLDDADRDGSILAGARHATSTAVLLWKALASITVATEAGVTTNKECAEVERLYEKMGRLIELWRRAFGRFDFNTELHLGKAPSDVCHVFKVCSNDSDLAILLFCDLVDNLEDTLAVDAGGMLPSQQRHLLGTLRADRPRRNEQQLISAVQLAAFSPIHMETDQCDGTAAAPRHSSFAQNAGMYPWPRLMAQAYMLAINKLNKELGNSVMPSKYAVSMASGLQSCVQSLQMLRESLATYSDATNAVTDKSLQKKPQQA